MESKVMQNGNNPPNRSDNAGLALSNIDLKLLRVFKCVVEAGGLTAASNELGIGLAAISKQVSDLEVRLGMTLCSRGREGFELTEYGINAYEAINELFISMEIFRDRLRNTRNEILGDISICVFDSTITDPLSPLTVAVQRLHQNAPKVHIRLQTSSLDDIERGLNEGRLHCGIAPVYQYKDGLEYFPLYSETSKVYCSSLHPLFNTEENKKISHGILHQQKIINHIYFSQNNKNCLRPMQESIAQVVQVEPAATLILTGHFIGYLPEHYAGNYVSRGLMKELGDDSLTVSTVFCLVIKRGRKANPVINLFMKCLSIL
ncbi:LysR family transcriptional regulator [Affinibrenneria salicis]|uniref:LysR family transcriptional regulator n=1 Tax=Affinibrenneria salicis TaxID=2590031 RepID=A0A5J5G121_9GAMM|nr:LysR family transcriptional regulator [Affinibrenneria salicis]KAA9000446.1 LysR family transcriptional regulator [Affinibrenneria salicis]